MGGPGEWAGAVSTSVEQALTRDRQRARQHQRCRKGEYSLHLLPPRSLHVSPRPKSVGAGDTRRRCLDDRDHFRTAARRLSTRIVLVHYGADGRLLGLIAERATELVRRDESEFVPSGVVNDDASYLGPVAADGRGLVQRLDLTRLLPDAVRDILGRLGRKIEKKKKKNKGVLSDQLEIRYYKLSVTRLEPGGRADGVVVFDRPNFKQSTEKLFLQLAQADQVDQPLLIRLPFTPPIAAERQ